MASACLLPNTSDFIYVFFELRSKVYLVDYNRKKIVLMDT